MATTGDKDKGIGHKIANVILRLIEFCSAVIVMGILARFCYQLSIGGASANDRIVYTMVVAGMAIVYSFFLCPPFTSLFLSFPMDFIFFVMWLVAFCLLETKTSGSCNNGWYYDYWGYYWGGFWRVGPVGRVNVVRSGCSQWRTVLAFSFITAFAHLISFVLGVYVFKNYIKVKDTVHNVKRRLSMAPDVNHGQTMKEQPRDLESQPQVPPVAPENRNGA